MPQFLRDRHARFVIDEFLFGGELLRLRSTIRRRLPAGQLPVAILRVAVAQTMYMVNAGLRALRLEAFELIDIAHPFRDQAAVAGQLLGFVQHPALLGSADRDLPRRAYPWSNWP